MATMFRWMFAGFALCSLHAGVAITKADGHIHIEIDGKPFTDFYYGQDAPKPYIYIL